MRKIAAALLLLLSCSPAARAPEPTAAPPPPASEPPPAAAPAWDDPGPRFTRALAEGKARSLQDAAARATGQLVDKGHLYLEAALPELPELDINGRVVVLGERYGFATLEVVGGGVSGPANLLVRLTGEARVEALRVAVVQPASRDAPGFTQVVQVFEAARAPKKKDLVARTMDAASVSFSRDGWVDSFFPFASARLKRLAKTPLADNQRRARASLEETMSLYTGLTSVQEALQSDRGLRLRATGAKEDVPLAKLAPVELAAHPWPQMRRELQRSPTIEPLAAHVPNDVLYVHFHDLRTLAALNRELDAWLAPLAQVFEGAAGDRHIDELYNTQLAIERTALSEAFGNVAAGGVALLASDPLLREGTDLTIAFEVKSDALLESSLTRFEENLREQRGDLTVSTYALGKHQVRLLSTPDRAVNQHRLRVGALLFVSNSKGALEHILAVADGSVPSMAKSEDYAYMRALYPYDPAQEDGFAFLSDAFVAHVTGPRWKILAARRMQAQADLRAVSYAALLHGWLEGRPPASADELVKSGLLGREELRHQDGALIGFDPARGPSSAWGTARVMTPIADLRLERVTADEAAAYEEFRRTYQAYWQGFIDPIGVRITRRGEGKHLAVDARMLPLIQRTDYDDLIELNGSTRVAPPRPEGALQATFAIGEKARIRRDFDSLGQAFTGRALTLSWLGDWCMVGAGDRSALWDFALASSMFPANTAQREESASLFGGGARPRWIQALQRASLYAGVHVQNELVLAGVLTALRGFAESAAPGLIQWAQVEPFRGVPVTRIVEATAEVPEAERVALYYTVVSGVLLLSLDRTTLEQQIAAVTAQRAPKAHREPQPRLPLGDLSTAAQSSIDIGSGEGRWLARTVLGMLEHLLARAARNALVSYEVLARGLGPSFGPTDAARRQLALAYLGYEPRVPAKGELSLGAHGMATHPLYGTVADLRLPAPEAEAMQLAAFVLSVERLVMRLAFEGQDQHRGLHTRFEVERR